MTPDLFSDAYLDLRARFLERAQGLPGLLRDAPALSEKTLRVLWYEGRYRREGLKTTDGRAVSVVGPGEWNLDAGPDFLGAEVEIGGRRERGDVEVHLSDRDWARHGHGRDPAFNGVVLHVFLHPGPAPAEIRREDGAVVPSVCLDGRLPGPFGRLTRDFDAAGYPYASRCGLGACGETRLAEDPAFLHDLLRLAGDGRVVLKIRREGAPAETLYRGMVRALGYHRNKAPMTRLAEALPLESLERAWGRDRPADRTDVLEALLLEKAGLLPDPSAHDGETRRRLRRLHGLRRKSGAAAPDGAVAGWDFRGVRPANFPHRRLAGLAALLDRFFRAGLFPKTASPADFAVPARGYFARRARWGGRPFARPAALVGPDRAQALWVNVYLPLALGLCRREEDRAGEARLHRIYASLPLNEPVGTARLMAHRLLGSDRGQTAKAVKKEFQQQALIQLFQDFCDTKPWACQACSFPKALEFIARGRGTAAVTAPAGPPAPS